MKLVKKVRFVDEVEDSNYIEKNGISTEIVESDLCDSVASSQSHDCSDDDESNTSDPLDENFISCEMKNLSFNDAVVSACDDVPNTIEFDISSDCQCVEVATPEFAKDEEETRECVGFAAPECAKDEEETREALFENVDFYSVQFGEEASNFIKDKELANELILSSESVERPVENSVSESVLCKVEEEMHINSDCSTQNRNLLNDEESGLPKSLYERCKQNLPIKKQSFELNSLLKQYTFDVDSAEELKSAVFNAWCQVKKDEGNAKKIIGNSFGKDVKAHVEKAAFPKSHLTKEKCKTKARKMLAKKAKKTVNPIEERGQSKSDKEENEMAFKLWVKKKNEILKQKKIEKFQKEKEEKVDTMMSVQLKKRGAEDAYLAWKIQKYEASKREKHMKDWIAEYEQQKKVKRSEEALEMYYMWLENKHLRKTESSKSEEEKPPWIPPGKS